jgi:hypothetical protein
MTSDHPVRRFLARICPDETMARIVDPVLADMRFEGGPAWRGYLVLARALTVHTIVSIPAALVRVCADDDGAIPRAAAISLGGALVTALPFVLVPLLGALRSGLLGPLWGLRLKTAHTPAMFLLLVPQAMALTLPAAILLAFPVALRGLTVTRRIRRRAIALVFLFAALTGFVIDRVVPRTNQAFRVLVSGRPLPPGPNETAFSGLRRELATLKTFHGGETIRRGVEYTLHQRLALSCAPLPLGLLALALTTTRVGRRWPWVAACTGLAGYLFILFPLDSVAQVLLRQTTAPPALLAWSPTIVIALLALAIQRRASVQSLAACS